MAANAASAAAAAASSAAAAAAACAGMLAMLLTNGRQSGNSKPWAERLAGEPKGYGQLLRSKGFVWLATRPDLCGEFSAAGSILRFTVGGPWYASLPLDAWPPGEKERKDILQDFQEPHGDRRCVVGSCSMLAVSFKIVSTGCGSR
jgi:G3E family GTPase